MTTVKDFAATCELMTGWRRKIHAHPELGFEEEETSALVAGLLEEFGYEVHRGVGRTGVVGRLANGSSKRSVGLRADMDALPIEEANDVDYRSTVPGVMHACGHDAHATMALGAARALWRCRALLPETVAWRAIVQPAEETGLGALEMVEAGAIEGVRAIVALHVDP